MRAIKSFSHRCNNKSIYGKVLTLSSPNFDLRRWPQLDFIDYLLCPTNASQGDALVVSAEFKLVEHRLEAEVLVTGYVHDWEQEDPAQFYLAPLLAIQLPLATINQPGIPVRERAAYSEKLGIEALKEMFCELTQLARIALKAGGLRETTLVLKDAATEAVSTESFDVKDFRQNRKMGIALAHTEWHWKIRQDNKLSHIEFGKYRIPRSLIYFANLYSLARSIGVKEVRPRIENERFFLDAMRDYRNQGLSIKPRRKTILINQQDGKPRQISEQNEFTVLVAKLKRAKLIQNRP